MSGFGVAVVGKDIAGGVQLGGGQFFVRCEGSLVTVIGDGVAGHGTGAHAGPKMVEGSSFVRINGIPVCHAGNRASCTHETSGRPWCRLGA